MNSRTSTALWLLTTTLCWGASRSSSAEGRIRIPPELIGRAEVLEKGERAGVKGILLTRGALADLLKAGERRARTAEAAAERARRDAAARVEAAEAAAETRAKVAEARAGACLADKLRRERVYEDAIRRAGASPPWWRSSLVVGGLGALVGGGICAAAVGAAR